MAFQGSLKELPLPDIIQLVSVSGKTGVFTLKNGTEAGYIYLQDGQIVHAQVGDLAGEEAVYELAIWPQGEFVFTPGQQSPSLVDPEVQHQPPDGGGAADRRVAGALQAHPVDAAGAGVHAEELQHLGVVHAAGVGADLQDRRAPLDRGDRGRPRA